MTARTRFLLVGCGIAGAIAIGVACIKVDTRLPAEPSAAQADTLARPKPPDPALSPIDAATPVEPEIAAPMPAEKSTPEESSRPTGLAASAGPSGQASLGEIPGFRLMGAVPEPSSATLCDDDLWQRLGPIVQKVGVGEVFVDEQEWENRPVSYRVGVASFISKCTQPGGSVSIRGSESGELLAVYDPERGYVPAR